MLGCQIESKGKRGRPKKKDRIVVKKDMKESQFKRIESYEKLLKEELLLKAASAVTIWGCWLVVITVKR